MEVAEFAGGDDGLGDGEVGLRFVAGSQILTLEAVPGSQEDPFDIVFGKHGVLNGADLDRDVVP